ncbi:Fc.00g054580.m01.CDS01 [Cosmosporella sp. VM-42]
MADLLLPPRSVPALHTKPSKSQFKSSSKIVSRPSQATGVVGTVQKAIKEANDAWLSWKDGLTEYERQQTVLLAERRQVLCQRMQDAESHAQWDKAAQELDALEGNEEWKKDAMSGDYNPQLIEDRLRELDEARASGDIRAMMHLIRTALSRDLGGMDNVDLYRHSYTGTKQLIERYVKSTLETIEIVVTQSRLDHGVEYKDLLEGILFARQSFGRSALLLSGGGTFGMTHIGVLKALFEVQLLPRIISGASAGSIICAVICTKTDEEMPQLIQEFPYGDLAVFEEEDSSAGVLDHLKRLLTEGSWSDIKNLTRVMRGLTGDMTFQEAYNRSRRICNICVSTASIYELPRLLNYVTAPNVMIWSAVAASCSVPLVFNSSPLLVKDPLTGEHLPWNPSPQRWIDGSVDNDLPMTRLSELFNVNHFIVSQVNPHVVPFLTKDDHLSPSNKIERIKDYSRDEFDWVYTLTTLAKDEALHRLQFLSEVGFMPNLVTKFRSILSQKYSGDINILPDISMHDLPRLLRNPTSEFMLRSCLLGERATWPKLSRVRDRCAIELALDRAVHRLRARVVFSESQRDLRRINASAGNLKLNIPETEQPLTGPSSDEKPQKRHRRRSGSNIHVLPKTWQLLDSAITDDETEQEERNEMQSRRTGSPVSLRKPRLKRASKSHMHMRNSLSSLATLAQAEYSDAGAFDFSKPVTPPNDGCDSESASPTTPQDTAGENDFGDNEVGENDSDDDDVGENEARLAMSDPWSDHTWTSRGHLTSPTDDVETSEQGHSSDAHRDETEMSDCDPYDIPTKASAKSSATATKSPSICTGSVESVERVGTVGQPGWNIWD